MIGDCAVYNEGRRTMDGRLSLEDAVSARSERSFVWLELSEPSEREMEAVRQQFDLHELAVEDAHHAHQRPKIEEYGDLLFVVLCTAAYDRRQARIELGEIHLFLGDDYVIVVRHGGEPDYLSQIRERAEGHPELIRLGPGAVLYAVMDQVVDDYAPVIEELESDIDEVETEVFSGELRETTERIYKLKRELLELRRATGPLLVPLERLHGGDFPQVHANVRHYFRDIHDHLQRVDDRIEGFRELLTSVLQANVALVSIRQNDIVRKISGWAAILAVPTLITSLYGMNFKDMPELGWPAGYPLAIAAMLAVSSALYVLLRRIGWL